MSKNHFVLNKVFLYRWDPVGPTGPLGGDPLGGGPLGGPLGGGRLGGGGGRRNYGDAMRPPDWDNMFM